MDAANAVVAAMLDLIDITSGSEDCDRRGEFGGLLAALGEAIDSVEFCIGIL
jgi:hypothetical protein